MFVQNAYFYIMRVALFILTSLISLTLSGQKIGTREVVRIPIVVHVLYAADEQNISNEQIALQIESLNRDFSRTNENYDITPDVFKNVSADMEIEFCLATVDEDGNPSAGITRTETSVVEIGLSNLYFKTDEGGKDPWDSEQYINVWVADFGNTEILGSTPLAGEASPVEKDGILINYKYFGVGGEHQDMNRQLGKVLTHEMGHYFGLKHIWGSLNTMCTDDDDVTDTPLQNEPTFGCPSFPSPDECTQGNGIMYSNFMDYTDDACLSMFTEGQKSRVMTVINDLRSGLLESGSALCITDTEDEEAVVLKIYPNPVTDFLTVEYRESSRKREVRIYDISGKIAVVASAKRVKKVIDVSSLRPGIYFVSVGNVVRKVVIARGG